MDFSNVKTITIPEGSVKQITDSQGHVLWEKSQGTLITKTYSVNIHAIMSVGKEAVSILFPSETELANAFTIGNVKNMTVNYVKFGGYNIDKVTTYVWGRSNYNTSTTEPTYLPGTELIPRKQISSSAGTESQSTIFDITDRWSYIKGRRVYFYTATSTSPSKYIGYLQRISSCEINVTVTMEISNMGSGTYKLLLSPHYDWTLESSHLDGTPRNTSFSYYTDTNIKTQIANILNVNSSNINITNRKFTIYLKVSASRYYRFTLSIGTTTSNYIDRGNYTTTGDYTKEINQNTSISGYALYLYTGTSQGGTTSVGTPSTIDYRRELMLLEVEYTVS